MSRWRTAIVLFVMLAAQVSVFVHLRPFGVAPDVLLVGAIIGGLVGGDEFGARNGFVAGLLFDLVLAGPFGLAAGVYGVAGYASGLLGQAVDSEDPRVVPVGVFVLSLLGTMGYAFGLGVLGAGGLIGRSVLWVAVMVAIWAVLLMFPVRAGYGWVAAADRSFATGEPTRNVVNS